MVCRIDHAEAVERAAAKAHEVWTEKYSDGQLAAAGVARAWRDLPDVKQRETRAFVAPLIDAALTGCGCQ